MKSQNHVATNMYQESADLIANSYMSPNSRHVHLLVQNLNNQACQLISKGCYNDAIVTLKRGLELTEANNRIEKRKPCTCKFCSLEFYLQISEGNDSVEKSTGNPQEPSCCGSKKRKRSSTSSSVDKEDCCTDCYLSCSSDEKISRQQRRKSNPQDRRSDTIENNEGYIYRRPLVVSQDSIDGCHYMGSTLTFIVLFNTALAFHLKAVETIPFLADNSKERMKILQQPLKLYELAYQLHFDCKDGKPSHSKELPLHTSNRGCDDDTANESSSNQNLVNLRLMMLVTNNISEIHRLAGNTSKHTLCLQHLLNALMYMIHNCQKAVLTPNEKDGIFDNLAPILRTNEYAAAA